MYKEFIILPEFDKQWKAMNLTDDDLRRLEDLILENPEFGDVMQGTGGFRFPTEAKAAAAEFVTSTLCGKRKFFLSLPIPKMSKII